MDPNKIDTLTLIVATWLANASKDEIVYATDIMRHRVVKLLADEGMPYPPMNDEGMSHDEDMDTTQARALIDRIRKL